MRVRVVLSLDIDVDSYGALNGIGGGAIGNELIRDDVRRYVANSVDALLREQGVGEVAP